MAENALNPSRRGVLAALAIAPAVIAAPAVAQSSDFAAALSRMKATEAASENYEQTVFEPMHREWQRAVSAVPHFEAKWDHPLYKEKMSTANPKHVRDAVEQLARTDERWEKAVCPDLKRCYKIIAEGNDFRAAELARIRERYNVDALWARSNELSTAAWKAVVAAVAAPVSSAAELAEKLAIIKRHDMWDDEDAQAALLADTGRLAA